MKTCMQISDSGFRGKINVNHLTWMTRLSEPSRVGGLAFPM